MALYGHGGLEYRMQYNYQIDIFIRVYTKAPQDILLLNSINSTRLNYIPMNIIRQLIHQKTKKIPIKEKFQISSPSKDNWLQP